MLSVKSKLKVVSVRSKLKVVSVRSKLNVVAFIPELAIVMLMLCAVCAVSARAQTAAPNAAATDADALYKAQKWDEAEKAYGAMTKAEPSNARAWFRLGVALHGQAKYAEAVAAYQRANEVGKGTPVVPFATYNLAASYAKMGDKAKALDLLGRVVASSPGIASQFTSDSDFASIQSEPRYKELAASVQKSLKPCMNMEGYRQFDFWLGEWDVFSGTQKVGYNNVKTLQQGCVVEENWEAAGGRGTGQSFNFYNPVTHRWHQSYMGSGGDNWMMDGEYREGALRYEGHIYTPGSDVLVHMTFFNLEPGKVRQFAETSSDGGKTWTTTWDAIYVRRKTDAASK
jgi:tetratricopeptide (TPR) repeat protein